MAYPNEELTEHIEKHLWPRKPVRECHFCPAYTDTLSYKNELRSVLWSLKEKYADQYTFIDYIKACELAGIASI